MHALNVKRVAWVIAEAERLGVPVMVETVLWGLSIPKERRHDPELIPHICRIGAELGADIVKAPYAPGVYSAMTAGRPFPWSFWAATPRARTRCTKRCPRPGGRRRRRRHRAKRVSSGIPGACDGSLAGNRARPVTRRVGPSRTAGGGPAAASPGGPPTWLRHAWMPHRAPLQGIGRWTNGAHRRPTSTTADARDVVTDGRYQRGTTSTTNDVTDGRHQPTNVIKGGDGRGGCANDRDGAVAELHRREVGGRFRRGKRAVYNPATGEVIAAVPLSDTSDVERAVQAAGAAFDAWRETPVLRRARIMFRYKELLEEHKEELAAIITREHGKTLAEARAELERGIEVVEFTTGAPTLLMGKTLEQVGSGVDVDMYRQPLGVCVGICPTTFPA